MRHDQAQDLWDLTRQALSKAAAFMRDRAEQRSRDGHAKSVNALPELEISSEAQNLLEAQLAVTLQLVEMQRVAIEATDDLTAQIKRLHKVAYDIAAMMEEEIEHG